MSQGPQSCYTCCPLPDKSCPIYFVRFIVVTPPWLETEATVYLAFPFLAEILQKLVNLKNCDNTLTVGVPTLSLAEDISSWFSFNRHILSPLHRQGSLTEDKSVSPPDHPDVCIISSISYEINLCQEVQLSWNLGEEKQIQWSYGNMSETCIGLSHSQSNLLSFRPKVRSCLPRTQLPPLRGDWMASKYD